MSAFVAARPRRALDQERAPEASADPACGIVVSVHRVAAGTESARKRSEQTTGASCECLACDVHEKSRISRFPAHLWPVSRRSGGLQSGPLGLDAPEYLEGDVVLVNRLAFDLKIPLTGIALAHLGDPRRGDIVTFSSPRDGVRLIKRVVGLPGDVIAMQDKQLVVNGQRISYEPLGAGVEDLGGGRHAASVREREQIGSRSYEIQWLDGFATAASFEPTVIPAGQYLMLGDNRDDSADSRFIGLVARELLIGRAERILVSARINSNWSPRFERFGKSFYPSH